MSNTFVILARDAQGMDALREQHRADHLEHFKQSSDRILIAGPLTGDVRGSLVVYQADDIADARRFIEGDIYFGSGVWQDVDIHPFKVSTGRWSSL
jgi:uncharacterized protein YciI